MGHELPWAGLGQVSTVTSLGTDLEPGSWGHQWMLTGCLNELKSDDYLSY